MSCQCDMDWIDCGRKDPIRKYRAESVPYGSPSRCRSSLCAPTGPSEHNVGLVYESSSMHFFTPLPPNLWLIKSAQEEVLLPVNVFSHWRHFTRWSFQFRVVEQHTPQDVIARRYIEKNRAQLPRGSRYLLQLLVGFLLLLFRLERHCCFHKISSGTT
jgi:hypothetical protein